MSKDPKREVLTVAAERAVLVGCLLPGFDGDPNDPMAELPLRTSRRVIGTDSGKRSSFMPQSTVAPPHFVYNNRI